MKTSVVYRSDALSSSKRVNFCTCTIRARVLSASVVVLGLIASLHVLTPFLHAAASRSATSKAPLLPQSSTLSKSPSEQTIPNDSTQFEMLRRAYPEQALRFQRDKSGSYLVFRSGAKVAMGRCRSMLALREEWYDSCSVCDQLQRPYTAGPLHGQLDDAGRARCEEFFEAMYGSSAELVRSKCTTIEWPGGRRLVISRVNSVDVHLRSVLEEIRQRDTSLLKFLRNPGGSFVWRSVAGTKRRSAHSYGIAIDINVGYSDYWRYHPSQASVTRSTASISTSLYKNRIPHAIVECFEKHGFIWGGKWEHFDSMHFEYRPELCTPRCSCPR